MPQSGRVRRRWLVKSVNRVGSAALGWRIVVAMIALAALRSPAAGELVGVDLQLVIAIDVSSSMDESRRRVQREGYARAICSAEVLAAIKSGPHGRIAIACFGGATPDYQRVIAPWTIVETRAVRIPWRTRSSRSSLPRKELPRFRRHCCFLSDCCTRPGCAPTER